MREKESAERFEREMALLPGSPRPVEAMDRDLLERMGVAGALASLDMVGESRVRESLRERLTQALDERRARPGPPAPRRPWVMRRPMLAAELGVLLAVVLLAVVAPRSLAALLAPVIRLIEVVRVGDHTQILRSAPPTAAEVEATLEESRQRLASGESWFLDTPYGGFGGAVPPGRSARVERVSTLERLRSLTPMTILVPTGRHRDEPVRFDHAFVAPDGWVLMLFGSGWLRGGPNEILLSQFPLGEGRSVAYGRMGSRTTPDGRTVFESPELKTEEMSFGGQTVVWDPDPEPPSTTDIHWPGTWFQHRDETSALRWEENGVSHSLMGRSLTREEAVALFLSLHPLSELQ